jgi:hypothetical protein
MYYFEWAGMPYEIDLDRIRELNAYIALPDLTFLKVLSYEPLTLELETNNDNARAWIIAKETKRQLKYLSYSSFKLFERNPEEFYKRYLANNRPPREPQNAPMAVGSAFDAFVKADLHKLFCDPDPAFEKKTLFEAQVEKQCRAEAWDAGEEVYAMYRKCGAWDQLLEDMDGCVNPRFEANITGEISVPRLDGAITILGKPDVQYISKHGVRVVHDFKVNGYYSNTPPSPRQGYIRLMPGRDMHKSVMPKMHRGFRINGQAPMHIHCEDWAEQLSMYAWTLGEPVGADYILTIDQIVCNRKTKVHRVAKHASYCMDTWQNKLFDRLHRCWYACRNNHVFLDMPYEQSVARCQAVDLEIRSIMTPTFDKMTRRER